MSRRGHRYPSQVLARRHVTAINTELGPTETIRIPGGQIQIVARKTWAVPEQLGPGDWFVGWKDARLAGVAGRVVAVPGGPNVTIPSNATALDVPETEWPAG